MSVLVKRSDQAGDGRASAVGTDHDLCTMTSATFIPDTRADPAKGQELNYLGSGTKVDPHRDRPSGEYSVEGRPAHRQAVTDPSRLLRRALLVRAAVDGDVLASQRRRTCFEYFVEHANFI
jgi:hypothetical protein